MALVIVHNETGLFAARKNFGGDSWGLTAEIGEVQLYSKKGTATAKINGLQKDWQNFREFWEGDEDVTDAFGRGIPADGLTIYNVELVLGDPVG